MYNHYSYSVSYVNVASNSSFWIRRQVCIGSFLSCVQTESFRCSGKGFDHLSGILHKQKILLMYQEFVFYFEMLISNCLN